LVTSQVGKVGLPPLFGGCFIRYKEN
jgi:hypothetical protein